jgi:dihydroflavonol-4-reductase
MRVLLIGGTGFIGHHVANELARHGHEVSVITRNARYQQDPFYSRFRMIQKDLAGLEEWLPDALRHQDAVVYCAGATFKFGDPAPHYLDINVGLTKRFFNEISQFPSIRTVYISSMAALSGTKGPTIQRISQDLQPERGKSLYDASKIIAEGIVRDYAEKGLDVLIVNPGLMLGPRVDEQKDLSSSNFILNFINGKMPAFVESGHSFCDVRDVAKGIVLTLEKGQKGERYLLGGRNMTLSHFFERLCHLTGLRGPIPISHWFAEAIAYALQGLSYASFQKFKNPIPPDTVKSAGLFYFADSEKGMQDLGYKIRPFNNTLSDLIAFMLQNGLVEKKIIFNTEPISEVPKASSLLNQLMRQHHCYEFLEKNQKCVENIFLTNHALSQYLQRLHICSSYHAQKNRFVFKRISKKDLHRINQFFEYLYFSSNDFLESMSRSHAHD